ncbi:MAG TPA: ARMT1-like domain-containing protein [Methanothrix sp.]|nr:ARMT1-like domain-containing protein [Methanothrix sp.]HQE96623.1 ARMT1-like domain-containing protein [Methanothrix sp.]HUM81940.1 ARMT1-like domain-containing protein [Methanothrix sp.]
MKMASNCYPCILDRAKLECDMVFSEEEEKRAAVEELLDYMACHKGGVSALVGTERERIIKRRSNNPDPYRKFKDESNRVARDLLPVAEQFYEKADDKIEALIRIAAAANSMEFGVKGHDYDNSTFAGVFSETLNEKLYGDIKKIKERLESFGNVFYLTDNSGEVVFDLFLIGRLKKMGKRIVVGSKSEPVLNDVTVRELEAMSDVDVIATGDVVGTALDSLSDRARSLLLDPGWLILSKGMGNYETISEYEKMLAGRLIYLMRAKCEPVAAAVGVPRGSLVARAI